MEFNDIQWIAFMVLLLDAYIEHQFCLPKYSSKSRFETTFVAVCSDHTDAGVLVEGYLLVFF